MFGEMFGEQMERTEWGAFPKPAAMIRCKAEEWTHLTPYGMRVEIVANALSCFTLSVAVPPGIRPVEGCDGREIPEGHHMLRSSARESTWI